MITIGNAVNAGSSPAAQLPDQITNLACVGGTNGTTGTIDVSFTEVPSTSWSLLQNYLLVYKAGGIPQTPFDGTRIVLPKGTAGAQKTYKITGLTYNQIYGLRVYPVSTKYQQQTAAEGATATATPVNGIKASSFTTSTKIKLNVGGVPKKYLIVNQGKPSSLYDESCNGTWALMEDIYENRQWHSSNVNDYANSTIHSFLNSTFLNLFDTNIRNVIKPVKIPYRPGSGTSGTINSGANGLSCKIFLLSGYEVGWTTSYNSSLPIDGAKLSYFYLGTDTTANNRRIAYFNSSSAYWWLRSPRISNSQVAWSIAGNGTLQNVFECSEYSDGIRPALILPSNMLFNPTPDADGCYIPI